MNAKLPGSGFGSFDCTIRLGKGGEEPRCGHSSSQSSPLLPVQHAGRLLPIQQAGRGTGHMCKLSPFSPFPLWAHTHYCRQTSSHCDLTPIVNCELIMELTPFLRTDHSWGKHPCLRNLFKSDVRRVAHNVKTVTSSSKKGGLGG